MKLIVVCFCALFFSSCSKPKYDHVEALPLPHMQEIRKESCFTQGLVIDSGYIFESCGLYGESKIKVISLESFEVVKSVELPHDIFAEGLTVIGDLLYLLSWKEEKIFLLDKHDLSVIQVASFPGEWWGLTNDSLHLIASNGTANLYFFDPRSLKLVDVVTVQGLSPKSQLNELEFINGLIFANVFNEDKILTITKNSGLENYYQLEGVTQLNKKNKHMVLNGIAFNDSNNTVFITGKLWHKMYWFEMPEHD